MTWPYSYPPDIWLPVFTVFWLIAFSVHSRRHHSVPGALPFAMGSLFAALWTVGPAMENAAIEFKAKLTWVNFQTVWSCMPEVKKTERINQ